MKPSRCLITGSTGYVGANVTALLADRGWSITLLVRSSSNRSRLESILPASANVRYMIFDGTYETVRDAFFLSQPDVVFHLASYVAHTVSPQNLDELIQSNILLSTLLLENVYKFGGVFVNAGTYWTVWKMECQVPNSLYAATKKSVENLIDYYSAIQSVNAVTVKLTDVYGPNDWRDKLFNKLYQAHLERRELKMTPGEQKVNFVHVRDIAEALLMAAINCYSKLESGHSVVYAAGAETLKLREVVGKYLEALGSEANVQWGAKQYRKGEIMEPVLGDIVPGWCPKVSLDDGITEVVKSQIASTQFHY